MEIDEPPKKIVLATEDEFTQLCGNFLQLQAQIVSLKELSEQKEEEASNRHDSVLSDSTL